MTVARSDSATRGRPRDAELDRRIAEASLDVLADNGIAAFTIEAVALRAGVGKATIYRRYAGRDDVLAAALDQLRDEGFTYYSIGRATLKHGQSVMVG